MSRPTTLALTNAVCGASKMQRIPAMLRAGGVQLQLDQQLQGLLGQGLQGEAYGQAHRSTSVLWAAVTSMIVGRDLCFMHVEHTSGRHMCTQWFDARSRGQV